MSPLVQNCHPKVHSRSKLISTTIPPGAHFTAPLTLMRLHSSVVATLPPRYTRSAQLIALWPRSAPASMTYEAVVSVMELQVSGATALRLDEFGSGDGILIIRLSTGIGGRQVFRTPRGLEAAMWMGGACPAESHGPCPKLLRSSLQAGSRRTQPRHTSLLLQPLPMAHPTTTYHTPAPAPCPEWVAVAAAAETAETAAAARQPLSPLSQLLHDVASKGAVPAHLIIKGATQPRTQRANSLSCRCFHSALSADIYCRLYRCLCLCCNIRRSPFWRQPAWPPAAPVPCSLPAQLLPCTHTKWEERSRAPGVSSKQLQMLPSAKADLPPGRRTPLQG